MSLGNDDDDAESSGLKLFGSRLGRENKAHNIYDYSLDGFSKYYIQPQMHRLQKLVKNIRNSSSALSFRINIFRARRRRRCRRLRVETIRNQTRSTGQSSRHLRVQTRSTVGDTHEGQSTCAAILRGETRFGRIIFVTKSSKELFFSLFSRRKNVAYAPEFNATSRRSRSVLSIRFWHRRRLVPQRFALV